MRYEMPYGQPYGQRQIRRRYFPRYIGGPADGRLVPTYLFDELTPIRVHVPVHVPTVYRPSVEADDALSEQATKEALYHQHKFAMGSSDNVLVLWAESSLSGEEACSRVWLKMLSAVGA